MTRVKPARHRQFKFDFEVGYFIKSPCKDCENRINQFPACSRDCMILDRVQNMLTHVVSSTKR